MTETISMTSFDLCDVVGAKTGDLTLGLRSLATADDFDPSFAVLVKDSETLVRGLRSTQDIVQMFAGLAAYLAAVCFGLDRSGKVDLDDDDKNAPNNGSLASNPTVAKVDGPYVALVESFEELLQAVVTGIQRWEAGGNDEELLSAVTMRAAPLNKTSVAALTSATLRWKQSAGTAPWKPT